MQQLQFWPQHWNKHTHTHTHFIHSQVKIVRIECTIFLFFSSDALCVNRKRVQNLLTIGKKRVYKKTCIKGILYGVWRMKSISECGHEYDFLRMHLKRFMSNSPVPKNAAVAILSYMIHNWFEIREKEKLYGMKCHVHFYWNFYCDITK